MIKIMNNNITKIISIIAVSFICFASTAATFTAIKIKQKIEIDGIVDSQWQQAPWYNIDKLVLGVQPSPQDFSGKFKVMWDQDTLYLMAEITDDVLYDGHADPLESYWDDDCLEIFLDENHSGGDHQFNFNAFAYHVALDNQVVDIAGKKQDGAPLFQLFNNHLTSRWRRDAAAPHKIIWEMAIKIYKDNYKVSPKGLIGKENFTDRSKLFAGKILGFMVAYCDNDGSKQRESFIGSTVVPAINGDSNRGYKDASVFDSLVLKDK